MRHEGLGSLVLIMEDSIGIQCDVMDATWLRRMLLCCLQVTFYQ